MSSNKTFTGPSQRLDGRPTPTSPATSPVTDEESQHKDKNVANKDKKDNTQVNNFGANNPSFTGDNNTGGNQFQGSFSGPISFGTSNTTQGNTQTGGGGNNPQVQGYISAGTGGNVNLGVQGANVNSGNQQDDWTTSGQPHEDVPKIIIPDKKGDWTTSGQPH